MEPFIDATYDLSAHVKIGAALAATLASHALAFAWYQEKWVGTWWLEEVAPLAKVPVRSAEAQVLKTIMTFSVCEFLSNLLFHLFVDAKHLTATVPSLLVPALLVELVSIMSRAHSSFFAGSSAKAVCIEGAFTMMQVLARVLSFAFVPF